MVCIRAKSLSNFIACDGATASIAGFSRKIVFYKLPLGGRSSSKGAAISSLLGSCSSTSESNSTKVDNSLWCEQENDNSLTNA
jgi:hypothetical protein